MSGMLDYIAWRGDLSFEVSPVNEVDNFIFCMASYVDYNRLYNSYNPDVRISLYDAARQFVATHDLKTLKGMAAIIPWEDIRRLMRRMGQSRRFSAVAVSDFTNEIDVEGEMQFSAVTYHINDGEMFVAFRGTDDTLVGWKEDFRLMYLNEIPAQKRAMEYLSTVAGKYPDKRIYIGGHSKGGNLAKYSAAFADESVFSRIEVVYNNDGPGFLPDMVSSERFERIENLVINFVPQSSLIGQMFQHRGRRIIIKSSYRGVYQHDMFGWDVQGARAVIAGEFTRLGEKNYEIFNGRIHNMTLEERREVADVFCDILDQTGAKCLIEISEAKAKSALLMVKNYGKLEKDKRQLIANFMTVLFNIGAKNTTKKV